MEEEGLRCRTARMQAGAPIPGWADDLAILLETPASDVVATIQRTAHLAHKAMAQAGVTVNFGIGKTEVVPLLYGPGSASVRRDLLSQDAPTILVPLCHGGSAELRVVKEYLHLGGLFSHDCSSTHDIERRRRECELPFRRLRATLLRNPYLSSKEKAHLLCSLILPKFLHGAGLWHFQRNQEEQAFRAAIMGFLRRSVRPVLGVSSGMASDVEVCTALQVLLPEEVLARLHIMQLAFMAAYANDWLTETVLHASSWIAHALVSLRTAADKTKTEVPDDARTLLEWIPGRQVQLRNLARKFKKLCLEDRRKAASEVIRSLKARSKFIEGGGIALAVVPSYAVCAVQHADHQRH